MHYLTPKRPLSMFFIDGWEEALLVTSADANLMKLTRLKGENGVD